MAILHANDMAFLHANDMAILHANDMAILHANVGSLTTRQCYYKGIYVINPNYCLYICIYDVHIIHIWTYDVIY